MWQETTENDIKARPRIGFARQMARNLLKEVELTDPPISLGKIIQHLHAKKNLSVLPVFDFGEKVSGVLVVFEDSATIGFNKKEGWYRRRFTIAHEIGHLLTSTTCSGINQALNNTNDAETVANEFAAELLMPLKAFKADFKKGIKKVDELSEKYRVSKEAVGWEIVHSGVLSKI